MVVPLIDSPRTSEPLVFVVAVVPVALLSDCACTAVAFTESPVNSTSTLATFATASSSALVPVTVGTLLTLSTPTVRTELAGKASSEVEPLVTFGVGGMSVVPASLTVAP